MARDISKELQLPEGIAVPNPIANLDYYYGPWNSVGEALIGLPQSLREQGRTVGIITDGKIQEYWFKEGIDDSNLVLKSGVKIVSNSLKVQEIGGEIHINTWESGSNSGDKFFDANFARPGNWEELETINNH